MIRRRRLRPERVERPEIVRNPRLRDLVYARDGGRCARCKRYVNTWICEHKNPLWRAPRRVPLDAVIWQPSARHHQFVLADVVDFDKEARAAVQDWLRADERARELRDLALRKMNRHATAVAMLGSALIKSDAPIDGAAAA